MARFPALQWFPRDWIADTRHLTLEQRGAHHDLLMFAWCRPKPELPDDDADLARFLGITVGRWRKIRPAIESLWQVADGVWTHKRLTAEHAKAAEKSSKNSEVSRTRWKKTELRVVNGNNDLADTNGMLTITRTNKKKKERDRWSANADSSSGDDVTAPEPPFELTPSRVGDQARELAKEMAHVWNEVCGDSCPEARTMSDLRRRSLVKRFKDDLDGDLERWRAFCRLVRASSFLAGQTRAGFTATIDWVIKPANFIKIVEGNYVDRATSGGLEGYIWEANDRAAEQFGAQRSG